MTNLSSSSAPISSQMPMYGEADDHAPSQQTADSPSSPTQLEQKESRFTPSTAPEDWRYESAVETVEGIIKKIESGDMELAEIFDQFAIAVDHLQSCETFLKQHRQQVDVLVETLSDEANF